MPRYFHTILVHSAGHIEEVQETQKAVTHENRTVQSLVSWNFDKSPVHGKCRKLWKLHDSLCLAYLQHTVVTEVTGTH